MPPAWKIVKKYDDIIYQKAAGMAKITINRPEKRNAFRPQTIVEMHAALLDAREDQSVGVIFLTGAGPAKDGKYAFCAGGDQSVRGHGGYIDGQGVPRLNVLEVQKLIRSMPKVVVALGAGYAIGGYHHAVGDDDKGWTGWAWSAGGGVTWEATPGFAVGDLGDHHAVWKRKKRSRGARLPCSGIT